MFFLSLPFYVLASFYATKKYYGKLNEIRQDGDYLEVNIDLYSYSQSGHLEEKYESYSHREVKKLKFKKEDFKCSLEKNCKLGFYEKGEKILIIHKYGDCWGKTKEECWWEDIEIEKANFFDDIKLRFGF